jgi:hypothetical protein
MISSPIYHVRFYCSSVLVLSCLFAHHLPPSRPLFRPGLPRTETAWRRIHPSIHLDSPGCLADFQRERFTLDIVGCRATTGRAILGKTYCRHVCLIILPDRQKPCIGERGHGNRVSFVTLFSFYICFRWWYRYRFDRKRSNKTITFQLMI